MAKDNTHDDYREESGAAAEEQQTQNQNQKKSQEKVQPQENPFEAQMGAIRRARQFLSEKLPEWAYNAFWGAVRLIGKTIRTIVFGEDATMRNAAESFSRTMDAERFKAEQEAKREQDREAAREMAQEAEREAQRAKEAHEKRDGQEAEKEGETDPAEKKGNAKDSARAVAASMGYTVKDADNPDVLQLSREGKDGKARDFAIRVSDMKGMDEAQMKEHIKEASSLARAQRFVQHKGLIIAGADKNNFVLERPGGASFSFPRHMLATDLKTVVKQFRTMEKEDPLHKEPVIEGMHRPVTQEEASKVPEPEHESEKPAEPSDGPQEPPKETESPSPEEQENEQEAAQGASGEDQKEEPKDAGKPPWIERDPIIKLAAEVAATKEEFSIGEIQRTFGVGFNRASDIMDELEKAGIVGPRREDVIGREVLASPEDVNRLLAESAAAPEPTVAPDLEPQAESTPAEQTPAAPIKGVPLDIDLSIPEIRFIDTNDPYYKLAVAGYNVEENTESGAVQVSDQKGAVYNFAPGDQRLQDSEAMKHTFSSLQRLGTTQEDMVQQVPENFGKVINRELDGILSEYGIAMIANERSDDVYVFASDGQKADTDRSWPISQSSLALGDANELKRVLYEVKNREAIEAGDVISDDVPAAVEAAGIVAALREKAGLIENGEPAATSTLELTETEGKVEVLAQDEGFLLKEGTMEADLPSSKDAAAFTNYLSSATVSSFLHSNVLSPDQSLEGFRPEPSAHEEHMMAAFMLDVDDFPDPEPEYEPEPYLDELEYEAESSPDGFFFDDDGMDYPDEDGGSQRDMDAPYMDAYDEEDLDL